MTFHQALFRSQKITSPAYSDLAECFFSFNVGNTSRAHAAYQRLPKSIIKWIIHSSSDVKTSKMLCTLTNLSLTAPRQSLQHLCVTSGLLTSSSAPFIDLAFSSASISVGVSSHACALPVHYVTFPKESHGPRKERHIGQAASFRVTSLTENTSHYVRMSNVVISEITSAAFYTLGL